MSSPRRQSRAVSRSGEQPRAWQRMLSGRRLDLLDPSPLDIEIEDIAHGLARVARWNGQTLGTHAFSVAQHCLMVEEIFGALNPACPRSHRLMALLHDAPEYVVGDLISPFKAAIGLDYKAFEMRLLRAIHTRFGLPPESSPDTTAAIKNADRIAAYFEATRLAGFSEDEGELYFGNPTGLPRRLADRLSRLEAWPTEEAQSRFLVRFRELVRP
ncbi:MAG TPA: HD family hydrolase [Hyphomicrobiaceae bacterium]